MGKNNAVADTLSHMIQAIGAEGIDYAAMVIDQQSDNDLQNLQTTSTGLCLKKILFDSATTIWCNILTSTPCPVVLPGWHKSVFDVVHNLLHPGIQMTHTMVANKFVWCNMNKQVTEWARSCIPCQQLKIARHMHAPCCNISRCHSAISTPSTSISCQTAATVSGSFVPALHHGQVHVVARSYPSHRHLSQVLHPGTAVSLGHTFQPSNRYLFR